MGTDSCFLRTFLHKPPSVRTCKKEQTNIELKECLQKPISNQNKQISNFTNIFQGYTPSKAFTHWQRQSPLKSSSFEETKDATVVCTPKRDGRGSFHLVATPDLSHYSAGKSPRLPMIYEGIDVDVNEDIAKGESEEELEMDASMQGRMGK